MSTTEIRQLDTAELPAFATIVANAYPDVNLHTPDERQKAIDRWSAQMEEPGITFHGAYRDGTLVGGMKLYDYTMNIHGAQVPTGGVGLVAVDLLHKKEHVARDLIASFIRHYRDRGAPLVELYAFRPDFYRAMGFGYGTKQNEYAFATASLPKGPTRAHVRFLTADDVEALQTCYERAQRRTHGLIARSSAVWGRFVAAPDARFVGCVREGQITGYLAFTFRPDPPVKLATDDIWVVNDLVVEEMVYQTPDALAELLTFLHSQADQVRRVIFRTQDDELHFLPADPRDGSGGVIPHVAHQSNRQGVGIMYRVTDVPAFFAALGEHDFGGQTLRLTLDVRDTLIPENAGPVTFHLDRGRGYVVPGTDDRADAHVSLDVAELSSLLMGSVSLRSPYDYGLAQLSDPDRLEAIDRAFRPPRKPICLTNF